MNEEPQYYVGSDGKGRLIPGGEPKAKPRPYRIVIRRAWIAICLVPVVFVAICSAGIWGYHKNWHQDLWKRLLTVKSEREFVPLEPVPRKGVPGPTKTELGPEPHNANAIPVLPPQGPEEFIPIPPQEPKRLARRKNQPSIPDERQEAHVRRQKKKVIKLKRDLRRAEEKVSKCHRFVSRCKTAVNEAQQRSTEIIKHFEHEEELRRQDRENRRNWSRYKARKQPRVTRPRVAEDRRRRGHRQRYRDTPPRRLSQDRRSIRLRRRDIQFAKNVVVDVEADLRKARIDLSHAIKDRDKIMARLDL